MPQNGPVPPARIQFPHHYRTLDPAIRRELVDHAGGRRLPDLRHALPAAARASPTRVSSRCTRASTSRATTWRRGSPPAATPSSARTTRYLNNDADTLHERAAARRRRHGRVAPRARLPPRRPARQLGGRLAVRVLPRAGGQGAGGAPRARALGRRVPLAEIEMPMADGFVLLAAHLGEGRFLLDRLDPSVVDEADPVATTRASTCTTRERLPPDGRGTVVYAADFVADVPRRAARALRAPRPVALASGARRRATSARGSARRTTRPAERARPPRAPRASASLPPHLPDARRPAVPRPGARPVGAPARLDLLLRARSGRRQLRRGPGRTS